MVISYNWLAAIVTIASIILIVAAGRFLLFRIPAFQRAVEFNTSERKRKWRDLGHKYHHRIKSSQKIGLITNLFFFVVLLPLIVTLEPRSVGKVLLDAFVVLMVYDFFYYVTHRFLFHGKGYFRRVHAVHHQARSRISSVDAFLLHPLEAIIGIALFYVVTVAIALITGEPFHAASIVITYVVFTQINQLNHTRIDLPYPPFRTINRIAIMHDAHHIDMHKGNYATITLLYDWLFGTLEKPVAQEPDRPVTAI
jgi:sterol desaturase/sphingolipid hydroxylase (fatty acid hydroxylase superfamily)